MLWQNTQLWLQWHPGLQPKKQLRAISAKKGATLRFKVMQMLSWPMPWQRQVLAPQPMQECLGPIGRPKPLAMGGYGLMTKAIANAFSLTNTAGKFGVLKWKMPLLHMAKWAFNFTHAQNNVFAFTPGCKAHCQWEQEFPHWMLSYKTKYAKRCLSQLECLARSILLSHCTKAMDSTSSRSTSMMLPGGLHGGSKAWIQIQAKPCKCLEACPWDQEEPMGNLGKGQSTLSGTQVFSWELFTKRSMCFAPPTAVTAVFFTRNPLILREIVRFLFHKLHWLMMTQPHWTLASFMPMRVLILHPIRNLIGHWVHNLETRTKIPCHFAEISAVNAMIHWVNTIVKSQAIENVKIIQIGQKQWLHHHESGEFWRTFCVKKLTVPWVCGFGGKLKGKY